MFAGTSRSASKVVGTARVSVTNVGDRAGANAVMLFASAPVDAARRAKEGVPLHTLIAFDKVLLAPGQSTVVSFDVKAHALLWANRTGHRVTATEGAGVWTFWTGTAADRTTGEGAAAQVTIM